MGENPQLLITAILGIGYRYNLEIWLSVDLFHGSTFINQIYNFIFHEINEKINLQSFTKIIRQTTNLAK